MLTYNVSYRIVTERQPCPHAFLLPPLPWFSGKYPPAMQETQEMWVQSLGEDTLEGEMATYSRSIAWEMPWTEEPAGLQSIGLQKSRT